MASAATHQPATASGQPGSRSSRRPTASTPKINASAMASAAHAYQATLTSQDSSGTKNAMPKTSPMTNDARSPWRYRAITSRAGPTAASGQRPAGGNATASATPPAAAASRAHGSRSLAGPAGTPLAAGEIRPAVARLAGLPSGICMAPSVAGYAGLMPPPGPGPELWTPAE